MENKVFQNFEIIAKGPPFASINFYMLCYEYTEASEIRTINFRKICMSMERDATMIFVDFVIADVVILLIRDQDIVYESNARTVLLRQNCL